MPSIRSSILFAFAIVALTAFSLGCADQVTAPRAPVIAAAKPVDSGPGSNYEKRYLTGAIDAAELISEMAQVCIEKQGLHAELMTFCQDTATQSSHDVSLLQSWLSTWYGIDYTPSLSGPDQRLLDDLRSLEGADFEVQYLESMVRDYTTLVRQEQHCYGRAVTTELIAYCFNTQLSRSNDMDQMKSWLCNWYADCR